MNLSALLLARVGMLGALLGAETEDPARLRYLDIDVRESVAFVGRSDGLATFDVSDPADPRPLGRLRLPSPVIGVTLSGDLAYLAGGTGGLYVVDVGDPREPVILTRFRPPGRVSRIELEGAAGFIADDHHGLRVVRLRDPAEPRQIARIGTRFELRDLAVRGGVLATAEGAAGVRLFDVSRPERPRERHRLREAEGARHVALTDDLLLVTTARELQVYSRDSHRAPKLLSRTRLPRRSGGLAMLGNRALISGGGSLEIVDLSDPAAPLHGLPVPIHRAAPTGRITVVGDLVFVAADLAGMAVVRLADGADPEVLLPRKRSFKVRFPGAEKREEDGAKEP